MDAETFETLKSLKQKLLRGESLTGKDILELKNEEGAFKSSLLESEANHLINIIQEEGPFDSGKSFGDEVEHAEFLLVMRQLGAF